MEQNPLNCKMCVCCSSVQSLSCIWLFVTSWTTAHQASLSITNSWSPPKPMSIESVMPSNHLILCHPFLLLPSIFPSIRVFSNESALRIRWPKHWSFSFNISPSVNIQGWFPLGLAGLISLQFKGLSVLIHSNQWTSDQQEWSLIFSLGERTRRETCLKSWMGSGQEHLSGLPLNLQSRLHLNHLRWMDLLGGAGGKAPTCPCRRHRRYRFDP